MAKENKNKVPGEMNAEELENVAGGWCAANGMGASKEVRDKIKNITYVEQDGRKFMQINFKNGAETQILLEGRGFNK